MKFSAHCTPPNSNQPRVLRRGDIVIAVENLDKEGANVRAGTLGVVFEEVDDKRDAPIVRWMNFGVCDVVPNDVEYFPTSAELLK
jgi:hypothetical protein